MDPEHEIARRAGLHRELDDLRYSALFFGMAVKILAVVSTSLFVAGTALKSDTWLILAAGVAALAAIFALLEYRTSRVQIPNILSEAKRRLVDSDDPKEVLLQSFHGAERDRMLDEGFRDIPRSRAARSQRPKIEVMGRGFYKGNVTATAEEFAVLYQNKVIAMSRVIAIDGNAVWLKGSDQAFEGGPSHGGVWGEVVRAMAAHDLGSETQGSFEIVCLGLQSSTELPMEPLDESTSLSRNRAQRLVNTMANRSLTWTEQPNVRVLGFYLGKALTTQKAESELERRQRSGIIILLTRSYAYEAVLSFVDAIGEVMGVTHVNGTNLSDYQYSDNISARILTATLGGSSSTMVFSLGAE